MSTTLQEIQQLVAATGKYKLEAENTEGANAYAFRAHHVPLDLAVFLKVLDPAPTGDLFAEPRLLVEATRSDSGESNLVRAGLVDGRVPDELMGNLLRNLLELHILRHQDEVLVLDEDYQSSLMAARLRTVFRPGKALQKRMVEELGLRVARGGT